MTSRPDEREQEMLLRSLMAVGPSKPVGYLPLHTIEEFVQITPEAVVAALTAHGLATVQFGPTGCCIKSGALYACHREALAALLQANADAIRAMGLPLDPEIFVAHIAAVWFENNHPAYPIIAKAFGHGL